MLTDTQPRATQVHPVAVPEHFEVNILAQKSPIQELKKQALQAKGLKEGEPDLMGFVSLIDQA